MSWQPGQDPIPGDRRSCAAIEHVIVPRARDIGGFEVRRALPSAQKQMVGPFIFFDQMGPAEFLIGHGIDVRPHPHIGLATVTYLFEGEVFHRDSLGSALAIRPGEVNLMTAGRGIVHSERETGKANLVTGGHGLAWAEGGGETARGPHRRMFGIQAWAALPKSHEEQAPAFTHHGRDELPRVAGEGKTVRVVIGSG
ncbi:MAG TPA: pirin family protein, partial [Methylomirabilota bacterium]|nr:pirin family protein [Methylomirabilota bacterium]